MSALATHCFDRPCHLSALQLWRAQQVSRVSASEASSVFHALPTFPRGPPLPLVMAGTLRLRSSFRWTPPNATCPGWVSHSLVWASTGVFFQVSPWTRAICISVHLLHGVLSSMRAWPVLTHSLVHPQGTQEMLTYDSIAFTTSTPVADRKTQAQGREVHRLSTSTQEVIETAWHSASNPEVFQSTTSQNGSIPI